LLFNTRFVNFTQANKACPRRGWGREAETISLVGFWWRGYSQNNVSRSISDGTLGVLRDTIKPQKLAHSIIAGLTGDTKLDVSIDISSIGISIERGRHVFIVRDEPIHPLGTAAVTPIARTIIRIRFRYR